MIDCKKLIKILKNNKVKYYTGVPDSVLKNLTAEIDSDKQLKNLIMTNEGSAVANAIGYYLATEQIPVVYMQNSGLSNSLNPLISIAHKKVYKIPMILIVGWRGSPNSKDEPQHIAQGRITEKILNLCGVRYIILEKEFDLTKIKKLISFSKLKKQPICFLIKNKILKTKLIKKEKFKKIKKSNLTRASFIEIFLKNINKNFKLISSTGFISREVYHQIQSFNLNIKPFYMVGGMGHTSSVALGYSLKTKKNVICLDGDGSFLMHLGSMVSISSYKKKNFKYVVLNNGCHESVGGQSTNIENFDIKLFSKSLGYNNFFHLNDIKKAKKTIKQFLDHKNSSFMLVDININQSENQLPRPKNLIKVRDNFIKK